MWTLAHHHTSRMEGQHVHFFQMCVLLCCATTWDVLLHCHKAQWVKKWKYPTWHDSNYLVGTTSRAEQSWVWVFVMNMYLLWRRGGGVGESTGVKVDFFLVHSSVWWYLLNLPSTACVIHIPAVCVLYVCFYAHAVHECMCVLEHIIHSPDISPEDPSVMRLQILTDSTQPSWPAASAWETHTHARTLEFVLFWANQYTVIMTAMTESLPKPMICKKIRNNNDSADKHFAGKWCPWWRCCCSN